MGSTGGDMVHGRDHRRGIKGCIERNRFHGVGGERREYK